RLADVAVQREVVRLVLGPFTKRRVGQEYDQSRQDRSEFHRHGPPHFASVPTIHPPADLGFFLASGKLPSATRPLPPRRATRACGHAGLASVEPFDDFRCVLAELWRRSKRLLVRHARQYPGT